MANEEHLKLLRQGVEIWNQWREENPGVRVDLSGANLREANLNRVNLSRANLNGVILSRAVLSQAILDRVDLREANLSFADLSLANLSPADLFMADLRETNLSFADLSKSNLSRVNLSRANLSGVNLRDADLFMASLRKTNLSLTDLSRADLSFADLSEAQVEFTIFVNVNLSEVKGLEMVEHEGPSTLGIDTIYHSKGKIPEVFLRGCGVPDTFITYIASLTQEAIQYYSCFISYSHKDEDFAQRLHADLQQNGVRCWYAPEDMKIGDEIRSRIDESIRIHDKLLLVLSENSISSAWVKKEVETAFEEEVRGNRRILFPVRLDTIIMETGQAWAADIRRSRHIGDFCGWKDHDAYQQAFRRLLRDLKAEV